nr:putative HVA22-like protein G isoform X1 [Ipomoea batatas]
MYSEAKLAFYIYLWFPKTKGTTYVYDSFFRPMVLKHEPEIDRNLLELRTAAGDIALMYWRKAASYGQTRIFDIFQFIVSQSTSSKSSPSAPQVCTWTYTNLYSTYLTNNIQNQCDFSYKFHECSHKCKALEFTNLLLPHQNRDQHQL